MRAIKTNVGPPQVTPLVMPEAKPVLKSKVDLWAEEGIENQAGKGWKDLQRAREAREDAEISSRLQKAMKQKSVGSSFLHTSNQRYPKFQITNDQICCAFYHLQIWRAKPPQKSFRIHFKLLYSVLIVSSHSRHSIEVVGTCILCVTYSFLVVSGRRMPNSGFHGPFQAFLQLLSC